MPIKLGTRMYIENYNTRLWLYGWVIGSNVIIKWFHVKDKLKKILFAVIRTKRIKEDSIMLCGD